MCACVCVCILDGEGSWVFAGRDLVGVWTAVYLTGYRDYPTGFHEPLLLPHRCHIGLKKVLHDQCNIH